MVITPKYSTTNTTKKSGRSIKYIVLHYTAGVSSAYPAARNTASWFSKSEAKSSADFVVDDKEVVQLNGDILNRYTWHCGGSKYKTNGGSLYRKATNANSIGIEVCSRTADGKLHSANDSQWSFSAAAINNANELVRKLMAQYNIPAERVIRHYDVTGKLCPGIVGWNQDSGSESAWTAFKAKLTQSATTATFTPYAVKVNTDVLNVRAGAGTSYAVNTQVKRGEVYTIVAESSGWGKLKSGAGWISLAYTVKV